MAVLCILMTAACENHNLTDPAASLPETEDVAAMPAEGIGREETVPIPVEKKPFTVCIDPGHGFIDGGAGQLPDGTYFYEDHTLEKDITMSIAKKLKDSLELQGFTTIMTHDGETIPAGDTNQNDIYSITERCVDINRMNPDYLISIHADSTDDDSVNGIRLYYMQSGVKINRYSGDFASAIAHTLSVEMPDGKRPQTIDQTDDPYNSFAAVRDTKMPAVLIEVGFMSNESDREKINDEKWQKQFAASVAAGVTACYESIGESYD